MDAYPLSWPAHVPRTPAHAVQYSRFRNGNSKSQGLIQREMLQEIDRLGGKNIIVSTNVKLRNDGLPYAKPPEIKDYGVAVYFDLDGQQMCFACDMWATIWENMRGITKTIEAIRGIERWGSGYMMRAAFTGFTALPPPMGSVSVPKWWDVLNVPQHSSLEFCEMSYRKLAREAHPDNGGSNERMTVLNEAIAQARKEKS